MSKLFGQQLNLKYVSNYVMTIQTTSHAYNAPCVTAIYIKVRLNIQTLFTLFYVTMGYVFWPFK